MKLTDEQFEDIVTGRIPVPDTLDAPTRHRLGVHRALRERLQRSACSVSTPAGLAQRVEDSLARQARSAPFAPKERSRVIRVFSRHAPALAAAAVLILAVGVWVWLDSSRPAFASAQPAIYDIHQANLARGNTFQPAPNPAAIARRLKDQAGTDVTLPKLTGSCSYLGSTLATFRDKTVGCVVVQSEGQTVTVLCVADEPETLGFGHRFEKDGRTWYNCAYSGCKMVATQAQGRSFIAVGEVDTDTLIQLVERIVTPNA